MYFKLTFSICILVIHLKFVLKREEMPSCRICSKYYHIPSCVCRHGDGGSHQASVDGYARSSVLRARRHVPGVGRLPHARLASYQRYRVRAVCVLPRVLVVRSSLFKSYIIIYNMLYSFFFYYEDLSKYVYSKYPVLTFVVQQSTDLLLKVNVHLQY